MAGVNIGAIYAELGVKNADQAHAKLKQFERQSQTTSTKVKRHNVEVGASFDRVIRRIGMLAAGYIGLQAVVKGLTSAMSEQLALKRLEIALGDIGIAADDASKRMEDFATQMQNATGIAQEKTYAAFQRIAEAVKDYEVALYLTNMAVRLAIRSNKELNFVVEPLTRAIVTGGDRLTILAGQFNVAMQGGDELANIFKELEKRASDITPILDTEAMQLEVVKAQWDDLSKLLGYQVAPTLVKIGRLFLGLARSLGEAGTQAAYVAKKFALIVDFKKPWWDRAERLNDLAEESAASWRQFGKDLDEIFKTTAAGTDTLPPLISKLERLQALLAKIQQARKAGAAGELTDLQKLDYEAWAAKDELRAKLIHDMIAGTVDEVDFGGKKLDELVGKVVDWGKIAKEALIDGIVDPFRDLMVDAVTDFEHAFENMGKRILQMLARIGAELLAMRLKMALGQAWGLGNYYGVPTSMPPGWEAPATSAGITGPRLFPTGGSGFAIYLQGNDRGVLARVFRGASEIERRQVSGAILMTGAKHLQATT